MWIEQSHLENLRGYAACRKLGHIEVPNQPAGITAQTYLGYFQKVYERSQDACFGLHFGAFLGLKSLHVVFDISLAASSIQQLLLLWKSYAIASFPLITIEALEERDQYSLVFKSHLQSEVACQILDGIVAFAYRELKIVTGLDAISLALPYRQLSAYELWFDCPIAEGSFHTITFHCAPDKVVTNPKQRKRIEILLPAYLHYLSALDSKNTSFARQVKLMILNLCEPDCPSIEQVASQFCITERTLQRRLKAEGTTFRTIVNHLKRELYRYIKQDQQVKTVDMSFMLGYSSSSAFLHALKSWNLS